MMAATPNSLSGSKIQTYARASAKTWKRPQSWTMNGRRSPGLMLFWSRRSKSRTSTITGQAPRLNAGLWKEDAFDAIFDLLIKDDAFTEVAVFGMSEPDVALALQQPWVSVDNDSQGTAPDGLLGKEHPHPRAYGTFPGILRKYVREEMPSSWNTRSANLPRCRRSACGSTDRGVLKAGHVGRRRDLRSSDHRDRATFENPNQLSEGMDYVLVNGVPVIEGGKPTGALPGKVLRGPGYQP